MNSEELSNLILDALEEIKGLDIIKLDVSDMTTVTDWMIVASGTSNRHVQALLLTQDDDLNVVTHGLEARTSKVARHGGARTLDTNHHIGALSRLAKWDHADAMREILVGLARCVGTNFDLKRRPRLDVAEQRAP